MHSPVAGWTCPKCDTTLRLDTPACPADGFTVARGFEPRALTGCLISDKLLLTEFVATGGFAHVYFAHHIETRGARVVKMLRPELAVNKDTVLRFRHEAQIAESLEHPHIVRIYDTGLVQGIPYLVMERIRGDSIRTLVEREGPMSPPRAARLVTQVADALEFAHARHVIHRDLTAANVIVRTTELGTETATVIDFGLAKAIGRGTSHDLTAPNEAVGTPAYMSPEQLGLGQVDARSDVFALAVVATVALFGRLPPLAGHDLPDATSEDPYGIDTLPRPVGLGSDVIPVLKSGLMPAKRERCATPREFADALAVATGCPVDSEDTTHGPRTRWLARAGASLGITFVIAFAAWHTARPPQGNRQVDLPTDLAAILDSAKERAPADATPISPEPVPVELATPDTAASWRSALSDANELRMAMESLTAPKQPADSTAATGFSEQKDKTTDDTGRRTQPPDGSGNALWTSPYDLDRLVVGFRSDGEDNGLALAVAVFIDAAVRANAQARVFRFGDPSARSGRRAWLEEVHHREPDMAREADSVRSTTPAGKRDVILRLAEALLASEGIPLALTPDARKRAVGLLSSW
ncbi:MAG: protein kinase [Gemmatimonadetes bacterium]|nr:protein kinase [Gemmatimonadota bacterium]